MKKIRIYRDTQNNKKYKGERIRLTNANVSSMKEAITIHIKDEYYADRLELFLYKVLEFIKD